MIAKKLVALVAGTVLTAGLVSVLGMPAASAAVGPGEDRQIATPTGWWTYNGIDAATVSSKLSANGARLTDIKVEPGSTDKFTVTMVKNAGAYASGWWWYPALDAIQVNAYAAANNARPTVLQGYKTSSGIRYATIMVSNTGANAEAWSWYAGSTSFVASKVTSSRRMVSFGRILGTDSYTVVFGSNSGTDATGWWWYYGKTTDQIKSLLSTNHARLVDLDRNDDGSFNVIMYSNPSGIASRWYVNSTAQGVLDHANQEGQRIIDLTPYYIFGNKYFASVMVNNLDATSLKLKNIISPKIDSGFYGFYFKQFGGSTLAALQSTKYYEPASALKVLYHYKTIDSEESGTTADTTSITYHYDTSAPTDPGICPDDFGTTATTNLKNADTQMMQKSDNRMTRGILDKYGKPAMTALAATLGMTRTFINHNIGCPTDGTHNWTTLTDLDKVYEAFQTGSMISSGTWRTQFRSRMLNQGNYGPYKTSICAIVSQEATAMGKSATVATNFCNAITWIAKGGSYDYGDSYPYKVDWSGMSLTSLPYKSGTVLAPKFFVFGDYVNQVELNSDTESTAVSTARGKLYQEAMRPYIHAALASGW
jgi:hypothetical protein